MPVPSKSSGPGLNPPEGRAAPEGFLDKSLRELDLINQFGIQVLAVREIVPERLTYIPKANFVVKDSDILIVMGEESKRMKLGSV